MSRKLFALVGCSKKKNTTNQFEPMIAARELYCSDLFHKRVQHVESRNLPWFIISAKSGCINPRTPLRVYDHTMLDKEQIDVAAWHVGAAGQFINELYYDWDIRDLRTVAVEIHAGKGYCEPLAEILKLVGVEVILPVKGLGIGEQLAYYSKEVVA